MGIASRGASALTKLAFIVVLLSAFGAAMAGVVYMSLSGRELAVPEIVGKDFIESEKELAALGLKIKRRADRASTEKMNTVLEQLPKAGETVKTGQMILVVVSKAGLGAEEVPSSLKEDLEKDSEKIKEMISDKPKKPKLNTNTNKRKVDTTRDVIADKANAAAQTASADRTNPAGGSGNVDKNNRNSASAPSAKPINTPSADKQPPPRSAPTDTRPRTPARP